MPAQCWATGRLSDEMDTRETHRHHRQHEATPCSKSRGQSRRSSTAGRVPLSAGPSARPSLGRSRLWGSNHRCAHRRIAHEQRYRGRCLRRPRRCRRNSPRRSRGASGRALRSGRTDGRWRSRKHRVAIICRTNHLGPRHHSPHNCSVERGQGPFPQPPRRSRSRNTTCIAITMVGMAQSRSRGNRWPATPCGPAVGSKHDQFRTPHSCRHRRACRR